MADTRTCLAGVAAVAALLCTGLAASPGSGRSAAPRPLRVGLVLSPGLAQDAFWSGGLDRAVRELGVNGKLLVPGPKEGYLPSFRALARAGYGLIITTGGAEHDIQAAAREFPGTRFAILDVHSLPHGMPRNVWGVGFAEEEVGYLAGYLAARMEQRRPGKHVVSSIGGIKIPPVDHFIAGYVAGARRADPGVVTLNDYASSFSDPQKCKVVAQDQIAKGSGVVFGVAGFCSFGALDAARQKGVWGIGIDEDLSGRGPHVLTSALKDGQTTVLDVVRATIQGRFAGGRVTVLGLGGGAVRLGRFSPRVPRTLVRELQGIRRQIVSGAIKGIPTTVR